MGTALFLSLRAAHALCSLGRRNRLHVHPPDARVESSDRSAGKSCRASEKGMTAFFAYGGHTVLTGIYLWRFTGGFDPEVSRSHAGMAFGSAACAVSLP